MSSAGHQAALAHAQQLPAFGSLADAQSALIAQKESAIARLLAIASSPAANLEFSVESLLRLERWYFEHITLDPATTAPLAESCAFYFGEVVARNVPDAGWVVQESAFQPGRYEIGVCRKLCTMMLRSFHAKLHHQLNRKRDSMWRTYHHYFLPNSKICISY